MTETEILEINGEETLCRWELVKDAGTDFPTYQAVPIITKEQFLACYNAWVRGEKERPQGTWLHKEFDPFLKEYGQCSNCLQIERVGNFCRNCRADMRGEEE